VCVYINKLCINTFFLTICLLNKIDKINTTFNSVIEDLNLQFKDEEDFEAARKMFSTFIKTKKLILGKYPNDRGFLPSQGKIYFYAYC
jgi:hypothetical protein